MKDILLAALCGAVILMSAQELLADRPHYPMGYTQCACEEIKRIRVLLEHQFNVVCDETHCEGGSSSSNGGELP